MRRLFTICVLLLAPVEAAGHGVLRRSEPAEAARLAEAPRELRLEFNERVDLEFARVVLVGPEGEAVLLEDPRHDGDSTQLVLVRVPGLTLAGEYTVQWQITGADGHPVRGEFTFIIEPGASGLVAGPPAATAADPPDAARAQPASTTLTSFDAESPLYAAVRWLTFTSLVVLIGVASFVFLLLPRLKMDTAAQADGAAAAARSRAASAGLIACGALVVAVLLRLLAQSVALHDPESALSVERIWAILSRTTWGWGWGLQAAATLVAIAGLLLARKGIPAGWWVVGTAVVALSATPALSGHAAATSAAAVVADTVHVLAAGGWLGTLLIVLTVGLPVFARVASSRTAAMAAVLRAFSPLALMFAAVLALTGVYAAWLHLPDLGSLWSSAYGRTLLLKLAALSLVAIAGAYNWRRAKPALERGGDMAPLTRSAGAELAVGAVVLAVTAVLVATPPPDPDRGARAASSERGAGAAYAEDSPATP